jgi:hypothetical protein
MELLGFIKRGDKKPGGKAAGISSAVCHIHHGHQSAQQLDTFKTPVISESFPDIDSPNVLLASST